MMKHTRWLLFELILLIGAGCATAPAIPLTHTAIHVTLPATVPPIATLTPAPTLFSSAIHAASGALPAETPVLLSAVMPVTASTIERPIDPPTSEAIITLVPGDGGPKPIGQLAYSIDLNIANTKGLTRTATISYLLYLPGGYGQSPQKRWPLILSMPGPDVWGSDPNQLAASGLPRLLTTTLDFPAIVLSPQAPKDVIWWGVELDRVHALLDYIQTHYAVDPKRVYLTGYSTGGFGAWAMALQFPQRFAALVPIAGGWDSQRDIVPRNICVIKDMPTWVFHGQQDDIVLPKKSEIMVKALQQCGSTVRFTLYPDANHRESFERAYAEPELYAWLFEQHLP